MGIVSDILEKHNDEILYGYMVGWTGGLNKINQDKCYVSMNSIGHEKYARKGIYNCGNMGSTLMLYYISQEDDFMSWYRYKDHIRLTGNIGDNKVTKEYIKELVNGIQMIFYNSQNIKG